MLSQTVPIKTKSSSHFSCPSGTNPSETSPLATINATPTPARSISPESIIFFFAASVISVLFGFTTGSIIVQGGVFVKENTSARDNASVMGVYNCIGCISQQLGQWLTGVEIDLFVGSVGLSLAFCLTFTTLAVLFVILTILAYRILKRISV